MCVARTHTHRQIGLNKRQKIGTSAKLCRLRVWGIERSKRLGSETVRLKNCVIREIKRMKLRDCEIELFERFGD